MFYSEFSKKLNEEKGVNRTLRCYGHLIEADEYGLIYVDGDETLFETLEEARQSILRDIEAKKLAEEVAKDTYEEITENTIASIIRSYSDEKITDTLIENYINLASSNVFTVDPIVCELRSLNKIDQLIEGKMHFVLDDGSKVALEESTIGNINRLLEGQEEIIAYMKESSENFIHVVSLLEK
jgi:hypothetical protein